MSSFPSFAKYMMYQFNGGLNFFTLSLLIYDRNLNSNKKMHGVGFEPTRFATPHLECGPLDRSGIRAGQY